MNNFVVERISLELASELWKFSPHATIFTRPDVLTQFFDAVDWWGASKRGKLIAAWPVPLDRDGRPTSSGWFYFVGPIWHESYFPPAAQSALSGTVPVYTAFIDALVATYGSFEGSLPPPQIDVRAFSWWRYHEGAPIDVRPRYSARISALKTRSFENIFAEMRKSRRNQLRRRLPDELVEWSSEIEPEELTSIYCERVTANRAAVLKAARRLLAIIDGGAGFASVARDEDGEVVAATAVLHDGVMANVVTHSVSSAWKPTRLSLHNRCRAIALAQQIGLEKIDFNGANSPARGDEKHSFGAAPVLYFDVSFSVTQTTFPQQADTRRPLEPRPFSS